MLKFNPSVGFSVDDVATVRAAVAAEWKAAFRETDAAELNTDPETPAGQIVDSETAAVAQKDSELLLLANQFNPLKAEGLMQDALAKLYFITRQPASFGAAECDCRGRPGTVIPAGAQIRSETDNTLWSCAAAVTVGKGAHVTARFVCSESGPIAAPAHSLTHIVSQIPGWEAVDNPVAAAVGRNEETQAEFEDRRYKSVALNSRSYIASVYGRVAQVANVTAVCARQNRTDVPVTVDGVTLLPHSVYVSAVGGDDTAIATALYNSVSAGCQYNGNTLVYVTDPVTGAVDAVRFDRPEETDIFVEVRVQKNATLPVNAEALIKDAVFDNFYGLRDDKIGDTPLLRVTPGAELYASRFYTSILRRGVQEILGIRCRAAGGNFATKIYVPINCRPELVRDHVTVIFEDE